MKTRFRLIRRGTRGGIFYCVDTQTGTRTSLKTSDESAAEQIVNARNQAQVQPLLNLQIAKAYLAGSDAGITTRTWRHALDTIISTKRGHTKERWERSANDAAFDLLRERVIVETTGETLLKVLERGTVSTNVFLRRLHNFCVDMGWIPWPLLPKRQWPAVHYKEKRAITREEHERIIERENNPERRAFYQLAWHLGGSQSDLATLQAEDVDHENRVISFYRQKLRGREGKPAQIRYGAEVQNILNALPKAGPLFPRVRLIDEKHRAAEFKRRCQGLGIEGITLHSYRYAWAERAKACGYPERFAQEALGHNSKAIHRAYARKAQVTVPPLEEYEQLHRNKVIPFSASTNPTLLQEGLRERPATEKNI